MGTERPSRVETHHIFNSLACIPYILLNKSTIIDLRNETSVAGRIDDVDGFMNITLKEVVFIDQCGKYHAYDNFMVQARMIRFVHVPQEINIMTAINEFFAKKGVKKQQPKPVRSFRMKRTQQQHLATIKEITDANIIQRNDSNQEPK